MDIRSVYIDPTVAGVNNFTYKIGDEKFLIGASLEEYDQTLAAPACDGANIWIQDPQNSNAISLSNGYMEGGCLAGFGCIPLRQGHEIIATVYHSTAGNYARLNLMFSDSPASVFGWTTKPLAKPVIPFGNLKLVQVNGAADDTSIDLRPGSGYKWEIVTAWAYHDDTAARALRWSYTDGTTTISKSTHALTGANVAVGAVYPINITYMSTSLVVPDVPNQLTLSNAVYATVTANTLTAGKAIYISALVREYAE